MQRVTDAEVGGLSPRWRRRRGAVIVLSELVIDPGMSVRHAPERHARQPGLREAGGEGGRGTLTPRCTASKWSRVRDPADPHVHLGEIRTPRPSAPRGASTLTGHVRRGRRTLCRVEVHLESHAVGSARRCRSRSRTRANTAFDFPASSPLGAVVVAVAEPRVGIGSVGVAERVRRCGGGPAGAGRVVPRRRPRAIRN